jgi:hypothetical protein
VKEVLNYSTVEITNQSPKPKTEPKAAFSDSFVCAPVPRSEPAKNVIFPPSSPEQTLNSYQIRSRESG